LGRIGGVVKSISILLVDDSAVFLRTAKIFLEQLDDVEVVGTATGGQSGLEQTLSLRPDIVLVDLNMPDFHGLELIAKLRETSPGTNVIALTMFDDDGHRKFSLASGAHEFVSKATMHADLPGAIYRLAGREEP
jgi:DNA-binding NarL/FixJ family response regulator